MSYVVCRLIKLHSQHTYTTRSIHFFNSKPTSAHPTHYQLFTLHAKLASLPLSLTLPLSHSTPPSAPRYTDGGGGGG